MITKTDFAEMLVYVSGLRAWIEAASGCLAGMR